MARKVEAFPWPLLCPIEESRLERVRLAKSQSRIVPNLTLF